MDAAAGPCSCITRLIICFTAVALVFALPTPEDGRASGSGSGSGSGGVAAVQPLSAAMSGNYTVSFAPLLAVLLNVFPRLMSAMRLPLPPQPLTATTHARDLGPLWEWERASLCSALEAFPPSTAATTGGRHDSDCLFYSCEPSDTARCSQHYQDVRGGKRQYRGTELVSETDVDECTRLSVRRCRDPRARYRPDADACAPVAGPAPKCR